MSETLNRQNHKPIRFAMLLTLLPPWERVYALWATGKEKFYKSRIFGKVKKIPFVPMNFIGQILICTKTMPPL